MKKIFALTNVHPASDIPKWYTTVVHYLFVHGLRC